MPRGHGFGAREDFDQVAGYNDVAQPQRRKHHLVEAAAEDHLATVVEPLHGGQRPAGEAELAVVVVFKDGGVVLFGPRQQLQAALQAHRHAGRVLVAGSDVDEAAAAEVGLPWSRAFGVETHGDDARARRLEDRVGALVAGVLHEDLVGGVDEEARGEVQALLHAGDDHDLLGGAVDAARCVRVLGDSLAEWQISCSLAAEQIAGGGGAEPARRELRPQRGGEKIERGKVGAEGVVLRLDGEQEGADAVSERGEMWTRLGAGAILFSELLGGEQMLRKNLRDVGAGAAASFKIALGQQLVERSKDGSTRKLILAGKFAAGRKLRAGFDAAVENLRAQALRSQWKFGVPSGRGGRTSSKLEARRVM